MILEGEGERVDVATLKRQADHHDPVPFEELHHIGHWTGRHRPTCADLRSGILDFVVRRSEVGDRELRDIARWEPPVLCGREGNIMCDMRYGACPPAVHHCSSAKRAEEALVRL